MISIILETNRFIYSTFEIGTIIFIIETLFTFITLWKSTINLCFTIFNFNTLNNHIEESISYRFESRFTFNTEGWSFFKIKICISL